MNDILNLKYVYASVIYSLIGIFILVISFVILEKITPENIYKEIVNKGNIALAIIAGAFIIAVATIISSAIHG
jgi:putative membrane protein